jgi:hypothetical protein
MDNHDIHRHQLINNMAPKNDEKATDVAIILWQQMATKIISLVGESGFKSLYVRSILLNASKFSCLTNYDPKSENIYQFTELKLCYEKQTCTQAIEVNDQLLLTLTDILATLIGEPLTTNLLCMAWGDVASDFVFKELNNE